MKRDDLPRLIEAIQGGNNEAFAQLYHEFHLAFFYMAYKLTNNEADAHDAVQDTFINIRKHIGDLKNPNVAIVWMKRILFNRCKNMFRKQRDIYVEESVLSAMEVADEREEAMPYEMIRRQSEREVVLRLLARIPYLYREPLILKYYDDAKMSEIARVLEIPEGTVKSRLRTGKKLLREQIAIYERDTQERVSFHVFPLGWCLYFCLHKEAAQFIGKQPHYQAYVSNHFFPIVLGGMVSVCVVVAGAAWGQEMQNRAKMQESIHHLTGVSDQSAYFYLRRKAHCVKDLNALTAEELLALRPYVEQLKTSNGPFYALLEREGWVVVFEDLIK